MKKPKVSIIVPVYNTEVYLEKCLESLIEQTIEDIEIICINDGSTDNSSKILEKYQQKDKRITILTQQNQGQSIARNNGINLARGEFIGFLDSDDWAEKTMLEELYQNAKEFGSNISMCSISVYDEKTDTSNIKDTYMNLEIFPQEYFNKSFDYKDCKDFLFRICVTPWNKIYDANWLKDNNIYFPHRLCLACPWACHGI